MNAPYVGIDNRLKYREIDKLISAKDLLVRFCSKYFISEEDKNEKSNKFSTKIVK
jgi:hypothetical protein